VQCTGHARRFVWWWISFGRVGWGDRRLSLRGPVANLELRVLILGRVDLITLVIESSMDVPWYVLFHSQCSEM
jgi:hypothetical protein